MPYHLTGLRSWNIDAEDFEAMVRFYRDGLGAEETTRHQVAGANVVRLKLGSTGLGLFDAQDGPRPGVDEAEPETIGDGMGVIVVEPR